MFGGRSFWCPLKCGRCSPWRIRKLSCVLRGRLVRRLRLRRGVVAVQSPQPSASVGFVVRPRLRRFQRHRLTRRSSGTGRQRLRLGVAGCDLPHLRCRALRPAPYLHVMPKIAILTLAHMTLAIVSGLVLGLGVFGAGFSDSATVRGTYDMLLILWQILNAPAGIYVLHISTPNWPLWGVIQLATSFFWANAFAIVASLWRTHRRA